jgi:transposase-like protein
MFKDSTEIKNILYEKDGISNLVVQMIKNMMETLMHAELAQLLTYEKYDPKGKNTGNSRNGCYKRDYETRYGTIEELKIPRDRNGEFKQQLIQPYSRREDWLEDLIIKMYSRGMSTRDIAALIEKLYGPSYSATTVSNITDIALEELNQWHNRPLKKRYSVLFIDGLSIKIRRDTVDNEAAYIILGIDEDGYREILDFYIGTTESATVWKEILNNLKSRGLQEVLLGVMDGLSGLEDAFLTVYPKADVQRCIVHKVRNLVSKIRKKDYLEFTSDLKVVYRSPNRDMALLMLDEFKDKWERKYPNLVQSWIENTDTLFKFYDYPASIHQAIYTTNWIERAIKEIRKRLKTKDSLPNQESAEKLLYLTVLDYNDKWAQRKLRGFSIAREELLDMFKRRYSQD